MVLASSLESSEGSEITTNVAARNDGSPDLPFYGTLIIHGFLLPFLSIHDMLTNRFQTCCLMLLVLCLVNGIPSGSSYVKLFDWEDQHQRLVFRWMDLPNPKSMLVLCLAASSHAEKTMVLLRPRRII
ncbi:uncharacterized protein LOC119278888 isoform X2 [Triticum dicoccoides]|uniref:uncharacterized protein LOC119278888 isoform X2 n=1 Tax=Triticum dicoccoides TaxID=85692 RepID=UPI00188E4A34|nr:uncharacterized protein LOC119278888 isoform X2 [Triticum dicoccoides]